MLIDTTKIAESVKELNGLLEQFTLRVTFTKKDGTERVMLCTKKGTLIPEEHHPKTPIGEEVVPKKDRPLQLLVVFDIEKQAWRSFNLTSVKKAEIAE